MDHQSNPTATRQVGAAKKHCDPTELKASRKTPADTSSGGENVPLPEPPIRQVPVNVTRRTGPAVTVLPPPNNRQQSSGRPERRVTRRDHKRRVDGGEDSDSDSDRDESRRTHEADGGSGNPKKSSHEDHDDAESSTAAAIEREELERRNQARAIRMRDEALLDLIDHREYCRQHVAEIKPRLIKFRKTYLDCPPLCKPILYQQDRLQVCLQQGLDIARAWPISDWSPRASDDEITNVVLPDIVASLEVKIARQYDHRGCLGDFPRDDLLSDVLASLWQEWVIPMVNTALEKVVFKYDMFDHDNISNQNQQGYIRMTIAEAVQSSRRRPTENCRFDFIETMIDAMVNHFWDKVIHKMSEAAMSTPRDKWLDEGVRKITFHRQDTDDKFERACYNQWIISGFDTELLKELCYRWHERFILKLERAGRAPEPDIQREFCVNLTGPQTVSLITARSDSIIKLEELTEADLDSFGWFQSREDNKLWHCESAADEGNIWKVNVDGEILGMFGTSYPDDHWFIIELESRNRFRKRDLNSEEEYALRLIDRRQFEEILLVQEERLRTAHLPMVYI